MELEVFGKRERKNAIIVADFIWPVSNLILTLVVYYVRHWTFMHLWLGGISLLALPCLYFIPESPRWLAINNKVYILCFFNVLYFIKMWQTVHHPARMDFFYV